MAGQTKPSIWCPGHEIGMPRGQNLITYVPFWKENDGGGRAMDVSPNGNHFDTGSWTWPADYAHFVAGSSNYALNTAVTGLSNDITVAFRARINTLPSGNAGFFQISDGTNNERIVFYLTSTTSLIFTPDNSNFWGRTTGPSPRPPAGVWISWAVVLRAGARAIVYYDGEVWPANLTNTMTAQNNLDTVQIASFDQPTEGSFLDIDFDYFAIYNGELTTGAIADLHARPYREITMHDNLPVWVGAAASGGAAPPTGNRRRRFFMGAA